LIPGGLPLEVPHFCLKFTSRNLINVSMDINRANPFCAPHRQSGVFVRRRRTYVTRMNELHVHYREIPLYHPYAMRTPIRVEKKSVSITSELSTDLI
jgi:sucrose-6-phosphate hydrolase SacC (GH32 family)